LEDLPAGHPIITREALESIGEYAFSTLRGLTLLGGQVKIDINLLSDMMLSTGGNGSPSAQVVSILKPAALAFLEIESTLPKSDADDCLELNLDRSSIDFDFLLTQKSYALTVNAVSALAVNRPVFFKDGAVCLARRAADPPKVVEDGPLNKSGILTIQAAVRACSLTLLRNALSVTTNSWQILHKTLVNCDMEIQADKALTMARQTTALKTAGRAARNRANMFYEWEAGDQRTSKRQRETDDALAKMRAAKAARGLGHGIQLPTSMVDSIDLVLANLSHLPGKRPSSSSKTQRKTPFTLDFVFDAIMTNGASLAQEEGRWYSRDGGTAWSANLDSDTRYELSTKLLAATDDAAETKKDDQKKMFHSQCQTAAAEALGRIVTNGSNSRISNLSEFANQIAARLAWSMKGVVPSAHLQPSQDMAMETIQSAKNRLSDTDAEQSLDTLATSFPLVASCLALEATSTIPHKEESATGTTNVSLSKCLLNEAYAQACSARNREEEEDARWKYERSLEVFVGSMVHASERANDKPNDSDRKRVATQIAATMQRDLAVLPRLTPSALTLISAMCDIDDITKKAAEAGRKQSQQTIAASASLNAAKQAAEKRATAALLALRDAAFQRSDPETRRSAVGSAVGLAAGRLPASASCEDKALKLVMNVLFAKSESLANNVVDGATSELKRASDFAVEKYNQIQVANREAVAKEANTEHQQQKAPFAPDSDEEKQAMEKVRKPAVLFMALCVRRPEIIKTLFKLSSVEHADVLSKAVRQNMSKLARAAGTKHGAAPIALKVAEMTETAELPLLLAFLDNLAPGGEKNIPSDDFIEACHKIQETKAASTGLKEVRFLIPVVSAMKRDELVAKLPEFVDAEDKIFLAALERMADRNGRHALLFRDEPDPENPSLKGMTLCEQLVFLHQLDFAAAGLPQKRYLDAIRLCLDNDELFNDRLVMSALDHMSGSFLTGVDKLPLAYMRTIILVCSKHESLHNWICHILLPRLVEGKIYTDRRQWEGWMRCAKMLENSGDPGGSSSLEAINKLPPEQLGMYHARYGNSE
jgi:symplekin